MIASIKSDIFQQIGSNFFQIFKKLRFFWFLMILSEYAMAQNFFYSFVVGLTSTNFGEACSKFSHDSRTLVCRLISTRSSWPMVECNYFLSTLCFSTFITFCFDLINYNSFNVNYSLNHSCQRQKMINCIQHFPKIVARYWKSLAWIFPNELSNGFLFWPRYYPK